MTKRHQHTQKENRIRNNNESTKNPPKTMNKNSNSKTLPITNSFKLKWIKFSNQKDIKR